MVTARACAVVMLLETGVTPTVGVINGAVTVTDAVPEALWYVAELALSGVYLAVSVSEPVASEPVGIVMVTEPALSVLAEEAYPPLDSTTEPVGAPLDPETAIVTESDCVALMLLDAGVTVTVGVVGL